MSTAAAAQGTAAAEVAAAAVAVPVPVAAPAAAPAGAAVVPEPSDAPGISQEQLRVWREKFEAKVVTLADDARSLMSEDKADLIVDLLRNWDSLTPAQRKAKTQEIRRLWPGTMTVKGRPRHSQSQGGIEKANRLLQKRLKAWMDGHQQLHRVVYGAVHRDVGHQH